MFGSENKQNNPLARIVRRYISYLPVERRPAAILRPLVG